jgi:gas vesicle protein
MSNADHGTGFGTVLLAFIAGAAAGAAAAYLTAPRRGEEMRQTLRRIPHATAEAYTRAASAARDAFVEVYDEEIRGIAANDEPTKTPSSRKAHAGAS